MTVRHPYSPLILLIDDSAFEQCLLIDLLSGQNYRVTVADNGVDGYRKALLAKPDLILLDVQMPGMDGFAVCTMLKANPETLRTPVIFLSGCNQPQQRLQGLMLGAVDYIAKPFSTAEEVLARIRLQVSAKERPDAGGAAAASATSATPAASAPLWPHAARAAPAMPRWRRRRNSGVDFCPVQRYSAPAQKFPLRKRVSYLQRYQLRYLLRSNELRIE